MSKRKEPTDSIDEMLQNIERVEAPMFLFTRIQARISQQLEEHVPVKYVYAAAFSLMVLLVLNVWTMQESTIQTKDNIAVVVEGMDLMPSNSFY
jgi:hypothetical protein